MEKNEIVQVSFSYNEIWNLKEDMWKLLCSDLPT